MTFIVLMMILGIITWHWIIPSFKRADERYRAIIEEFDNE